LSLVTHVDSHRSAGVRAVSRHLIDEFATAAARMNGQSHDRAQSPRKAMTGSMRRLGERERREHS
jgi:hypothetical protein